MFLIDDDFISRTLKLILDLLAVWVKPSAKLIKSSRVSSFLLHK